MQVITQAVLFISLISSVTALPTKQLKYSLIVEKSFHNLNHESVQLKDDKLIIVPTPDTVKRTDTIPQDNWFTALFDKSGMFLSENKAMGWNDEGHLAMTDGTSKSNTVFSIRDSKLCHETRCQYTLCPEVKAKHQHTSTFTLHHPESPSSDCEGGIKGVELLVVNQLGIPAADYEAPEFMYNTGKRLFI